LPVIHKVKEGLISGIYKELQKPNAKRISNPINKWANELNREFLKGVQMANKHIKKMFNVLSDKGNANQNITEILSHSSQKLGYHQENKQQMVAKLQGKRDPVTLLVGMLN
jgi:hypothetical protein